VPVDDDRLRDALREAALEPSTGDVLRRVRSKWARRRTIHRIERGTLVAAVFAALVVGSVVVLDDPVSEHQVRVATAPGSVPRVRFVDGGEVRRASVRRIPVVPDEGYVRGPLLASSGRTIAMAAYDRDGSTYTFPPSRIVRVDHRGEEVDRVDLQGEILSLADGEGARWALTRDKTVLGPADPEFRVKRIGPDGGVVSNAVPPGEQPVGRIAAGGGGVWVPVADGVLRFDPATGGFAAKVALSNPAERRAVVASGKFFFVTDGNVEVRLDPAETTASDVVGELPVDIELTDAVYVNSLGSPVLLGFDAAAQTWVVSDGERVLPFHPTFSAETISAANGVIWVDGIVDGVRSVAVLDVRGGELTIERTIRLTRAPDANVILVSERKALLTARGSLFRASVPR
jgi:hypothetical protein